MGRPRIVDGAAAVLASSASTAKERGWKPLGRMVSRAAVGVVPRIMGIGPVPATEEARVEGNEAFAAQYLAVEKALGLPTVWRRHASAAGRVWP